jgi:hypothetical protein
MDHKPQQHKKKEAMVMEVMLMMDVVLAMVIKVTCTLKLGEGYFWVSVLFWISSLVSPLFLIFASCQFVLGP